MNKGSRLFVNQDKTINVGTNWQEFAECKNNINLFYPIKGERRQEKLQREKQAKAICNICVVKQDCESYAYTNNEQDGIWGGLTETERGH